MIHLDIKTDYSFLKAYGSPQQIVERAKEIGAHTLGIADIGGTWGHIPFSKVVTSAGIKPLFGVQLAVVNELTKDPRHDLVTLIAKSDGGLQEQYEFVSKASQQFYYRPRLTMAQLNEIDLNYIIFNRLSKDSATPLLLPRGAYLSVGVNTPVNVAQIRAGVLRGVAMCSPLYPSVAYREVFQLVCSIGQARKTFDIEAPNQWMLREGEYIAQLKSQNLEADFIGQLLLSTSDIASGCGAVIPKATNIRPTSKLTVEQWCVKGAKKRKINLKKEPYKGRLAYELDLIRQKGFEDYFILIADLVEWSKKRMFMGPARGSSAGSLVCFLMGIVEVDPLVHNLMFERFIDVTRTDLPDVDIDFPDEQREEAFQYLIQTYGSERVARLGTVMQFKARSALNDVGKSYSIPKWEIESLGEVLIERSGGDARANMTIADTLNQFDKAKALVDKYPKLLMASHLEGHARQSGKHAAGVVISNDAIRRYCSIDSNKGDVAEITKYDAEAIGLMKIDALGLTTLSVLQDACDMCGLDPRHLYTIPLNDQKAFQIFKDDKVAGVFQFEGYAVRSLMRQMGVEEFNDIVALTSLARPGPLHSGSANEFIARRIGSKDWEYQHPLMHNHTSHTFGTIVYQEQVMSITRDLGDMDWQDVNSLRRAMSKSLGEEFFNKYRDKFLIGTRKKRMPDAISLQIWQDMCTFGSWAFNLSHAVSYALISYWCAYIKAYHPLEFAVAQLRRAKSDDHVFRLLRELAKEQYVIVPFDPYKSDINWSSKDDAIYGGFTSVKGVGIVTAKRFVEARDLRPHDWLDDLTPAQRSKLFAPNNTPWHNLTRLHSMYGPLYENPEGFTSEILPQGVRGPILNIEDIPEKAGEYCFIATLKVRNLRDLNETQSLVKRGGRVIQYNNLFLNLQVEDDTGSILCSVNRWKYNKFSDLLMEQEADGHDFIIRGRIREDGRRKIDIDNMIRLSQIKET